MTEANQEQGVPFPENTGDADDSPEEREDDQPKDEKLIPQAELDRILQKRLKRQEEQFAKKYADYEKLKADAEAYQKLQDEKATDAERWERERNTLMATLQEKEENLTKLQRANLIADLATEKGLPKSFWKRVQGETEEEIAEDMDSIIKDLGLNQGDSKEKTPGPKKKGSVYGGGGEHEDPEPDTDALVARIPRGPQLRVDKPRTYK